MPSKLVNGGLKPRSEKTRRSMFEVDFLENFGSRKIKLSQLNNHFVILDSLLIRLVSSFKDFIYKHGEKYGERLLPFLCGAPLLRAAQLLPQKF